MLQRRVKEELMSICAWDNHRLNWPFIAGGRLHGSRSFAGPRFLGVDLLRVICCMTEMTY